MLTSCCRLAYSSAVVNSGVLSTLPQSGRLRVVLVAPRNPLNIGASARAMSNFGFLHLRVVNPYELAFREARSAVGASPLLATAEEFKTVAEAVADCTFVVGTTALGRRRPQHPVKSLEQAAPLIRKGLAASQVALLFGSEKRGLSNEDLSHCHWLLRIPTREDHRSMNLGQAVAVCLYELARKPKAAPPPTKPLSVPAATGHHLERLTLAILDGFRATGFLKSPGRLKSDLLPSEQHRTDATIEEKTRRLVRRLNLSAPDAELLLGLLRNLCLRLRP